MRVISCGDPHICQALHAVLSIVPLANYLTSPLLEPDLVRKRANAVAFTEGVAALVEPYYIGSQALDGQVAAATKAYRRAFRAATTSGASVFRNMVQLMKDALADKDNYVDLLGFRWLLHDSDRKEDSVQQLVNSYKLDDLPQVIVVQMDRGNRTRRFISYGTEIKACKATPKYVQLHAYDLCAVLMEGHGSDAVYARDAGRWQCIQSDVIRPVEDLNELVSCWAQLLVFQRRV